MTEECAAAAVDVPDEGFVLEQVTDGDDGGAGGNGWLVCPGLALPLFTEAVGDLTLLDCATS